MCSIFMINLPKKCKGGTLWYKDTNRGEICTQGNDPGPSHQQQCMAAIRVTAVRVKLQ